MKRVSFFNLPPSPPDSHTEKEFETTPVPKKRRAAKPIRRSPISNGGDKSQRSITEWCTKVSPVDGVDASAAESPRKNPRREATKRGAEAEDTQAKTGSTKKNKMQNGVEVTKDDVQMTNGGSSSDNHCNAEENTSEVVDDIYEVEEILDYWVDGDSVQYLVRWAGWSEEHNTWEDAANLMNCQDKLLTFYHKRQEEIKLCMTTHAKNPKKMKEILKNLPVPPHPQPMEIRIDEFLESTGGAPSLDELNAKFKEDVVNTIPKWSAVTIEKYLADFAAGSLSTEDKATLRNQLLRNKVEKLRVQQLEELKKWSTSLNGITKGLPVITVINEVDLTGPPTDFTYVNDNVPGPKVNIPDDPITGGCQCQASCFSNKTGCCPKLNDGIFAYSKTKKVMVPPGTPIFECNKYCECGIECSNRVVQDGTISLTNSQMCIFRTADDKGWGVRTLKPIKKGTFVALYAGEVITSRMAEMRGKVYDREGLTYLFDLDLNESNGDCLYTIDAAKYGNISHFFNHSCSPNLQVYNVFVNCIDVNLPKLALFAKTDIPKGVELTFDYVCKDEKSTTKEKKKSKVRRKCLCGAANCRKFLF